MYRFLVNLPELHTYITQSRFFFLQQVSLHVGNQKSGCWANVRGGGKGYELPSPAIFLILPIIISKSKVLAIHLLEPKLKWTKVPTSLTVCFS